MSAGRYSSALDAEVVPAWRAFVGEALPFSAVSRAKQVAVGNPIVRGGVYPATETPARLLRKIASGETARPSDRDVWLAAGAARALGSSGDEVQTWNSTWCAGPLALFAASRFEVFAHVFLSAPSGMFRSHRKAHLLDDIVAACSPTVETLDFEMIRSKMIASGASDLAIHKAEKKFRRRPPRLLRGARKTWILESDTGLGVDEEAAFEIAWEKRADIVQDAAVVAARLVQENPTVPLVTQREIVLTMLRDALR